MTSKLPLPPTQNDVIQTVNNIIDDLANKQDTLTAGININFEQVPAVDTRSTATIQTVGSNRWQEVDYYNGKFIAVGNSGYVTYSTNGTTWATPFTVGSATWRGITYGNGKYIICGNNGRIATSTNGENWTLSSLTNNTSSCYSITYGNGKFIIGTEYGYIFNSTDGVEWYRNSSATTGTWKCACYGNNMFVLGNEYGGITTSTDGTNWTNITDLGDYMWNDIIFANNKFYIVSQSGYVSTSSDGTTWTTPTSIGLNYCEEIRYNGNCFVVVSSGNSSSGYGYSTTSIDGENWTEKVKMGTGTQAWFGLAYGDGKFVTVGDGGKMTNFNVSDAKVIINGANIVSSVDSTSTNNESVGAKLFYDTVGDIGTALNTINSGSSS